MPSDVGLGPDDWIVMEAASIPQTQLLFRINAILDQPGLDPATVADLHMEEA